MIIGFDGSRAFLKKKTGTENYSYQLLKALAKIDKTNQYIVYTRPFIDETIVQLMKLPGNFKVKEIPWVKLWTQGGLALQTFKSTLDVLFVPAHTLPIIKKPGLKTVITVHDLGSEHLPSMHQLKQRAYLGLMQKTQIKGATKIIAVSKATKRDLVKKIGLEPGKIDVVYEGYDKDLFKPVKSDALVDSLSPHFLFVGTVQPRKNLARLIEAFSYVILNEVKDPLRMRVPNESGDSSLVAQNDKVKLVIAGSRGWLSDEIYKLPEKLGIEDRVKFLGYVPDRDLPSLYSGAIALVYPSLFEGFGLPILEAQACGCPVVTSNVSSMPEVAGKGALYVNPSSVEDIIRGMREIRGIREKLIKAGFENIRRFSWEKCARETLRVLEKTAESGA